MILDFLRKPIQLKHFLIFILLSPIIIVILSVIVSVLEPSDVPSLKGKPYECGSFGDQKMRIDRRYLFFARVEYQDVNYWGKGHKRVHDTKGCDDQIQSASFNVKWPEMLPSKNGFQLSSNKLNDITFSLHQRTIWTGRQEDKDFFDSDSVLKLYLSPDGADMEINDEEINKNKVFNPDLGLYEISFDRVGNVTKKVFWQEKKGKGVSLVIKCLYFKTGGSDCKLSSHVPNYGFNTSYLNVYFHAELLPHWKNIQRDSLKFIDSLQIEENQVNASK